MFKEKLPLNCEYSKIGLFNFLNSEIGNPFENKLFEINGNSEKGNEDKLANIITSKYYISGSWVSKDEMNSYIKIDFKRYQFRFKAISFESGKYGKNCIGSFAIEGLNPNDSWITIHSFDNKNCYTQLLAAMDDFPKESYRYIRIKMIGPNQSGNNRLCIQKLDLYGILSERAKK